MAGAQVRGRPLGTPARTLPVALYHSMTLMKNDLSYAVPVIRDATEADMAAVQQIYAHHVLHGAGSFEEAAPTLEQMLERRADVLHRALGDGSTSLPPR